jgi:hypothetical protein
MKRVTKPVIKTATILILILAIATLAVARDKKEKAKPGPYVFSTKASAQAVKALIFQESLKDGYALDSDSDSDHTLQFRFSRPAQMPLYGQIFMASSACPGMTTKQVWSYALAESNGATKVTVQPAWDFPDDYCKVQTNPVPWSKPEEMLAFQAMLDKAPAAPQVPAAKSPAVSATTSAAVPAVTAMASAAQPATQPQVVAQDDDATPAQKSRAQQLQAQQHQAQQYQACLDLAKDNPSITCK